MEHGKLCIKTTLSTTAASVKGPLTLKAPVG